MQQLSSPPLHASWGGGSSATLAREVDVTHAFWHYRDPSLTYAQRLLRAQSERKLNRPFQPDPRLPVPRVADTVSGLLWEEVRFLGSGPPTQECPAREPLDPVKSFEAAEKELHPHKRPYVPKLKLPTDVAHLEVFDTKQDYLQPKPGLGKQRWPTQKYRGTEEVNLFSSEVRDRIPSEAAHQEAPVFDFSLPTDFPRLSSPWDKLQLAIDYSQKNMTHINRMLRLGAETPPSSGTSSCQAPHAVTESQAQGQASKSVPPIRTDLPVVPVGGQDSHDSAAAVVQSGALSEQRESAAASSVCSGTSVLQDLDLLASEEKTDLGRDIDSYGVVAMQELEVAKNVAETKEQPDKAMSSKKLADQIGTAPEGIAHDSPVPTEVGHGQEITPALPHANAVRGSVSQRGGSGSLLGSSRSNLAFSLPRPDSPEYLENQAAAAAAAALNSSRRQVVVRDTVQYMRPSVPTEGPTALESAEAPKQPLVADQDLSKATEATAQVEDGAAAATEVPQQLKSWPRRGPQEGYFPHSQEGRQVDLPIPLDDRRTSAHEKHLLTLGSSRSQRNVSRPNDLGYLVADGQKLTLVDESPPPVAQPLEGVAYTTEEKSTTRHAEPPMDNTLGYIEPVMSSQVKPPAAAAEHPSLVTQQQRRKSSLVLTEIAELSQQLDRMKKTRLPKSVPAASPVIRPLGALPPKKVQQGFHPPARAVASRDAPASKEVESIRRFADTVVSHQTSRKTAKTGKSALPSSRLPPSAKNRAAESIAKSVTRLRRASQQQQQLNTSK